MVTTPTVVALEMALPEMVPNRPEASTEILAAPPRRWPMVAMAMSVTNSPPPVLNSTWPMKMKITTTVVATLSGMPISALVSKAR